MKVMVHRMCVIECVDKTCFEDLSHILSGTYMVIV